MESSNLCDSPRPREASLFYISSPTQPKNPDWTFEENKLFENSLAEFNLDSPDLFEKISLRVPTKTVEQIKEHYEALVEDVKMIESGCVPLPDYTTTKSDENRSANAARNNSTRQQRRRGVRWTDEEHENFLAGLEKYGKGDWRSISRRCVRTRNATQVASHAQKYFLKLAKKGTHSRPGGASSTSDQSSAPRPS